MTRSKCRSITVVAIGCIGRTGHIFLEIAISIIISQWIYESFRRGNVTSGPWKRNRKNYLKTDFILKRHNDNACFPKQGNGGLVLSKLILRDLNNLLIFLLKWSPVKKSVRSSELWNKLLPRYKIKIFPDRSPKYISILVLMWVLTLFLFFEILYFGYFSPFKTGTVIL